MPENLIPVVIVVGILALIFFGAMILVAKFYRKVDQGKVLIVNTLEGTSPASA